MKDRISLIAAAAGGFMLSIAAASIIHGAPVTALKQSRVEILYTTSLQHQMFRQHKGNKLVTNS